MRSYFLGISGAVAIALGGLWAISGTDTSDSKKVEETASLEGIVEEVPDLVLPRRLNLPRLESVKNTGFMMDTAYLKQKGRWLAGQVYDSKNNCIKREAMVQAKYHIGKFAEVQGAEMAKQIGDTFKEELEWLEKCPDTSNDSYNRVRKLVLEMDINSNSQQRNFLRELAMMERDTWEGRVANLFPNLEPSFQRLIVTATAYYVLELQRTNLGYDRALLPSDEISIKIRGLTQGFIDQAASIVCDKTPNDVQAKRLYLFSNMQLVLGRNVDRGIIDGIRYQSDALQCFNYGANP